MLANMHFIELTRFCNKRQTHPKTSRSLLLHFPRLLACSWQGSEFRKLVVVLLILLLVPICCLLCKGPQIQCTRIFNIRVYRYPTSEGLRSACGYIALEPSLTCHYPSVMPAHGSAGSLCPLCRPLEVEIEDQTHGAGQ